MADLISRAAAIEEIARRDTTDGTVKVYSGREINALLGDLPAVDAAPIKPLSVWLAGYCVPPKYTMATNPIDSVKARAEGWETALRTLCECGLMDEGEEDA